MSVNTPRIAAMGAKFKAAGRGAAAANHTALTLAAHVAAGVFEVAPGAPHVVAHKPVKVTEKVVGDTAYVAFPGVARLVNDPTRPHFIVPKGYGGTRKKRQQGAALLAGAFGLSGAGGGGGGALSIPGIGLRAWAHHPGTKGKHFFEAAGPAAMKAAAAAYTRAHRLELAKHFIGG